MDKGSKIRMTMMRLGDIEGLGGRSIFNMPCLRRENKMNSTFFGVYFLVLRHNIIID